MMRTKSTLTLAPLLLLLPLLVACPETRGPGRGDADLVRDGDTDGGGGQDGGDAGSDADSPVDGDLETDTDADNGPPDPRWEAFLAEREQYLSRLAPPIVDCVQRQDTNNGVFHGCYDWHSACHGVFSLVALSRLLGGWDHASLADQLLLPENLARERAALDSGSFPEDNNPPGYDELPYGHAWFLVLARERALSGRDDLTEMGDIMAQRLREYVENPWRTGPSDICVNMHDNLSWAVLNLWQWGEARSDTELMQWAERYARDELTAQDDVCPVANANQERSEFFPPALLRAMAIVTILPADEREAWVTEQVPPDLEMTPIGEDELASAGAHLAGLNFSRAWGLWALWCATGERHFRDLYLDHIEASMSMPWSWDLTSDYMNSHWIAQFGVYAIRLSYEGCRS